jgi:hypothetical protein
LPNLRAMPREDLPMTLSALAPLDLLQALQTPAKLARNPLATQVEQWLASELPELSDPIASAGTTASRASDQQGADAHFLPSNDLIVPPAGEKIPDAGQLESGQ